MAGYRAALQNFSKGEISPDLEARFDLSAYQAGLRRARNVRIMRTGGVRKRPGTRIVAEAMHSSSRLIPFQFSYEQAYALDFGQAIARPYALGGAVLETGLKTTAITKAANAKITAAYHGYSAGDTVWLTDVQGMVEINDRFLTVVSVIDAHNFTVDFDSTNASTWTGDTGTVNTAAPAPPPTPPTVPAPTPAPTPPPIGAIGGGGFTAADPGSGTWDYTGLVNYP